MKHPENKNGNGVVEMPFYKYVISEKYRFIARNGVDPDVLYVSERLNCYLIQERQITVRKKDGKHTFAGCEVRVDNELPGIGFGYSKINEVFIVEDNGLRETKVYLKEEVKE